MSESDVGGVWPAPVGGGLDEGSIERIDVLAGELVQAVHFGMPSDVERILSGMGAVHLMALAVSVASIAEPADDPESVAERVLSNRIPPGWTVPQVRDAHTRWVAGCRDLRTREGEVVWQRTQARRLAVDAEVGVRRRRSA